MADNEEQTEPTAAAGPPETLGQILREARLKQDLTLEQLSTELRIEAKQLNALEENRFEHIGVPVFVKGYLKQYGLRLGLDVSDLLALYYKQTTLPDIQIQPSRTIKLHDERQITSWILAAIVLLAVIVGLAAWWWSGGDFADLGQAPARDTPAPSAPAAEPASFETPPAAAPEPVPAAPPPEGVEPQPQQIEDASPAVAPGAAPETPAVGVVDLEPEPARAAAPITIPLQFSFDQESWAEVTDARGERLLFGLTAAGRNVTVRGEPPFAIVLGNANSVRLTVDGEPYAIPTVGRQGNLARFAVDIAEE